MITMLSDQDIDRIANAVVDKLLGATRQTVDIAKEVNLSVEERKALSRDRSRLARGRK